MQYKILASDYDNTLMPFGEAKPRPAVVKAVKKLQAAGGKFVLSTGRSYPGIRDKNQLGGIRYDYAITCNGACVVDRQGNVIAEHPLTSEEMYVLVDFCEDYNYPLQFNFRDAYYAYCEYEYLHTGYQMMNSPGLDCVDGEEQDRHLVDMPHAAFAAMPPQEVERFHEKYGYLGLHWMQVGAQNADGYCYYDIVRGGMDKGVGLADLCAQMGLTLADAVAVGDSANDVGMLKVAGLSACMANGTPDAKAAADRIIGDVREDGVAALIEELWFDGPRAEPSGKAFAAMPPQEVERFHEKYGYLGLHWMQVGAQNADGYCYYDIVRGGMDKGVGLADLCAQMGLTLADAVAVGDSANDVGMLKVAGLSACMANGTPDAKAAADRIIGDVREDGVAALIEELWFDGPRAEPSGKDLGSAWGNIESAGGSL